MPSSDETKVSERMAYLGALAGGVAHEIRNPLGTINMQLQLLLEEQADMEGEAARRTRRKLEIIQKETRRLEAILNDFLRVARGEELRLAEYDLNELVEEILDLASASCAEAGIQIRKGLAADLPKVRMDASLVKQALTNIVKNGTEAMPDGGELIVRTSRHGDEVQIDVADTGIGIPEDKIGSIFRPYFTTKRMGTGIGLATTKRIIDEHQGSLTVTSEMGRGTNFTIRLPIDPAAAEQP